ncbi:carbon-nitrogen hydrolase family protein [Aneurinibacillus aneurinilyticus]|uniref:carbon-nitrogen hydrolase family protein n=1 Tax=Aneurinibacillus aneurinilyticus TaxID=1391 RepID=UPI002E246A9B|nr:carbon-nitrogen hydrolase family protein [Aneurinibacillus aneurinilyticus]
MRIAIAQCTPHLADKKENLNMMTRYLYQAKEQKAELVIFPELVLTGYSIGNQLASIAEEADGPSLQFMQRVCRELAIFALISFPEKNGNAYHISSAFIQDDGSIAGIYRKTHLFSSEAQYFTPGNEWPVFATKFGNIGVMICYDLEFPEVTRLLRLNGAEMVLVNTANMEPYERYQHIYMQSRAMENEIPLVICNRLGQEDNLKFFGHSMAVNHEGNILLQLDSEEALRIVDISLHEARDPELNYAHRLHESVRCALLNCLHHE